ncbi:MAG TPA: nucleoside hydrolase-like domain-containing protein [Bryobacteraceae bacterium]|nr:nucleoside hydrolase-like domain-containing protein [Bryobacteraceae bacterium]
MKLRLTVLTLLWAAVSGAAPSTFRVLVTTDLGGDPDDIQSLYRLVHYSDILRVEGIVSSSGPGAKNSADQIRHWIRRIEPNHLRSRGYSSLMSEEQLLAVVRQGSLKPGAPSRERSNEGSRLIIERIHSGRGEPLWVQAWGSLTDVAQAIHDDPSIVPKIRIYSIGSANTRADMAARQYLFDGMVSGKWRELWWDQKRHTAAARL